jgi:hypothetical protein
MPRSDAPTEAQIMAARAARAAKSDQDINLAHVGIFVGGLALAAAWLGVAWSVLVLVLFGLPLVAVAIQQTIRPGRKLTDAEHEAIRAVPRRADPAWRRGALVLLVLAMVVAVGAFLLPPRFGPALAFLFYPAAVVLRRWMPDTWKH